MAGVSAAEKDAALAAAGEDRPRCKCGCGEPMTWCKDGRNPNGGWWFCAVKRRATRKSYAATEKSRERNRRCYNKPNGGRETQSIRRVDRRMEKYEEELAELRAERGESPKLVSPPD